jgi:glyoxylase-like metal-dependent hydrolase (beta-lactamase superfamily II)
MSMRIGIAVLWLVAGSSALAQDAKESLNQALKNMGDIKTVQYTGSGATFTLGQSVSPTAPWPRVEVKSFTQTYDYDKTAGRYEVAGAQGPGASQFLSGDRAWNQAANVTPVGANVADARRLQLSMSPHGFLTAALASNATAKNSKLGGRKVTQVTFMQGKQRIVGTISGDHLVEKIETWIDNPVLGDMLVETDYTGYRDFSGFKFPARIVQKQGGFPVLDFTVTGAKTDVPLALTIPSAAPPAAAAVTVASQKLGDGVWYLTGGSHHSVLVEFRDHVAVIEAPQTEERSTAVIGEVKKLVPNKPIRYLINTHHHFDHSGGLRTYIAEGATVVTHQINKPFYERVATLPHTLNPDRLSREKKKAKIVAVAERHVLSDGARTVEIHHVQGSPHNEGILMAYLPKEKILVQVDLFTPPAPNAAPPATPNPFTVNLFENIERLKLDVGPVASLHGGLSTMADLRKTIGK